MEDNLNVKILESYVEIDKIHDEINEQLFDFITKALEYVELTDDDYQIEKSIILNKISIKDYILNSECCKALKKMNVSNYSIDELKKYLYSYDSQSDCSLYLKGILLYELLEKIENLVDKKVNLETKELGNIINNPIEIKNIDKSNYENYYFNIKSNLDNIKNISKLDEKSYDISIQILNDIFNFYMNGYPSIPDEYLEN